MNGTEALERTFAARRGPRRPGRRLATSPHPPGFTAAIPPSREQVREAMPDLLGMSARLRSADPVGARGVAALERLLRDGNGPCYVHVRPGALILELRSASAWLDTSD